MRPIGGDGVDWAAVMSGSGNKGAIGTLAGRGFALREVLIVIGVIAVLSVILLAWITRTRDGAMTAKCMATMRSLGQDLAEYASAYGAYPLGYYTSAPAPTRGERLVLSAENSDADGIYHYPWWSVVRGFIRAPAAFDNSTTPEAIAYGKRNARMYACQAAHGVQSPLDYACNPVIMPDLEWERAHTPKDRAFTNPVLASARPSDLYADSAVLWDATEIPPTFTTQAVVGYQVDNNPSAAIGATNTLMDPTYPSFRFRDDNGLYKGNPALGDDYPIYVYSDQASASSPPPLFAENVKGMDASQAKALGVPCWRHNGGTACNFLMGDGSVRTISIKWTGDASAPWTCELMRRQLRIKWPKGFGLYQGH
jgi:prepilin-type processing-associated H-X9-DG protein